MSEAALNPFRPTRWEHQRDGFQLIWFTEAAQRLCEDKSSYVRGSRGSGKTTLLKSICWEDLSKNSSLRLQRKLSDFNHIGIYLRFPDHISAAVAFQPWRAAFPAAPNPEFEFYRFFSLIVELACAERALTACHELRLSKQITYSPGQEISLVEEVIREFPRLAFANDQAPRTVLVLASVFRAMIRSMNEAAGRGLLTEMLEQLPSREPGEILSFVSSRLAESVRFESASASGRVSFKFCLDDCEVLNHHQQKSINTLVRTAKFPVSWVISYVGSEFEATDTYLLQQPLTDADRRIISLDRRKEADFKDLCQAVVSLRLLFSFSKEERGGWEGSIEGFFDLDVRFGRRDVNDMMDHIIQRSSSPVAKKIERISLVVRDFLIENSRQYRLRFEKNQKSSPIYETYVLLHWKGLEDAFKTSFSEEDEAGILDRASYLLRPNFEAWIRRKQRAALLHLASSLGFKRIPLAGSNVLLSLADGSVRDFLEIVGHVFDSYSRKKNSIPPTNRA